MLSWEKLLLGCSNNGEYPILCDTSPCVYRMKKVMGKNLQIYDTVDFIHDFFYLSEYKKIVRNYYDPCYMQFQKDGDV
ncbi:hypothetical protein [Pectinatus frisingensis]|uniref:hypothetical protein n=1 Tax=Pectinatus frisingensis TaxID=865 RepID=UPI0018C75E11|nr:hypothetical protein [Pectinatus frisingensis]